MWDELNRWWLGQRKPRPQPPEQLAVESRADSKSKPQLPRAEDVAECENALATAQPASTPQTIKAEESIQEPECVEAYADPANSPGATPDDFDADLASKSEADSDPLDPLDGDVDPACSAVDEPMVGLTDAPTRELEECFPTDWMDSEAPLPGPFGGRPTRPRGRRLTRLELEKLATLTPQQRLTVLDCWQRSGLPAKDFAPLVGVSRHTLYAWKQRFERLGTAGFADQARGAKKGSRLPDATRRAIVALKESQPDWGCERISNLLLRSSALPASPAAVARVLHEAGYQLHESPTRPHPDHPRRFERAWPNQLWQTDLFTFVLKRQNRRVYLVAFLDDHSRFLVSFGLHASQSTALVLEVFRAGVAAYQAPAEVLTDNGAQYVTWRGESAFHKELKQRGIAQIVAKPRHPQTLGKIERFWGTLWRECLETAVFLDLADARARIGHFIDWYNFQRVHSGIDGLVPADRYFHAAPEVARVLKERVAKNALELARQGVPRPPFYLTGQVGGRNFSLHAEGERVFLTHQGKPRQEVDLVPPEAAGHDALARGSDQNAMPPAVCPDGSPEITSAIDSQCESRPEPAGSPGTSVLDELTRIRHGSDAHSPGETGGEA
jgi:transposase InsO family protein